MEVRLSKHSIDLTLFSNRTRDLLTSLIERNSSVVVTRPINLGARIARGADLSARGPLGSRLHYSLSGNLADERLEQGNVSVDFNRSGARYGGSAELEYHDGVEGRRGADRLIIRVRYIGPIDYGLVRTSSYVSANASWSHVLSERLSAVLTVSDFIAARLKTTYHSDNLTWRQIDRERGPRLTVALTRSLGAVPKR